MKITSKGNEWEWEIKCDYSEGDYRCLCTFIVKFKDLIKEETSDRSGGVYIIPRLVYNSYVICPNCGNKIKITDPPKKLFSHYIKTDPDFGLK